MFRGADIQFAPQYHYLPRVGYTALFGAYEIRVCTINGQSTVVLSYTQNMFAAYNVLNCLTATLFYYFLCKNVVKY